MPVYFPGYSNVDANTMRYAMGIVTNPTGPNRYESMDMWRLRNVWGSGRGYAFSDYVGLNFYAFFLMYQGEGYVYDGCAGRDHWCYYDATAEDGSYVGPWGGPSTYNTERGYNNGTFLTFGYGYCWTYVRPHSGHNVVSYSYAPYNCRAFYVDILDWNNGNRLAGNFFAYAGGDQYTEYWTTTGFQQDMRHYCRLILWY
jgi:hypothetical protein